MITKVMIAAVDGYRYGGKDFNRMDVVGQLRDELNTLEQVILLPYLDADASLDDSVAWSAMLAHDAPMSFEPLAFDHPLWMVYSSGTTGMPKPIVHGPGGALLEGLQGQGLHMDLQPDDRICGSPPPAGSCGMPRSAGCCGVRPSASMTATPATRI
ncbi:AMP-binding protein [Stutzerimonas stutzeri]|uniref:AMP-binding protein n=1 Tax=Stutzerimonas stutzeri TaxID=316 RepID=UPI002108896E|nr:AMP-binding protein [Stutzerimonas stutzeri]MCQ4323117.1 AMP-binding protein [Stutzerimonas stutzeri]